MYLNKLKNDILKFIEVNVPFVFLEGYEKEIDKVILELQDYNNSFNIYEFSLLSGIAKDKNIKIDENIDYQNLIEGVSILASDVIENNRNVLLFIHGAENLVKDSSVELIDKLKRITTLTQSQTTANMTIIFSGENYEVPELLRKQSIILNRELPIKEEISMIIEKFIQYHIDIEEISNKIQIEKLVDIFLGLDEREIWQALSFSFYEHGLQIFNNEEYMVEIKKEIRQLKMQRLKALGTLELVNTDLNIKNDVAGLENLIEYIENKKNLFKNIERLIENNIDLPKGILLLGEPGTGKSLSAKAISNSLGLNLIKFDISQILGKYVGESEKRMHNTLSTVQFMSPCVLWIDEIEKAFAGVNKDNNEVMRKIFGQLLTWMSDSNKGVYVIATANNVDGILPPEFLRKGRFDDIFYIDRPNKIERQKIIELHLKKRNINIDFSMYKKRIETLAVNSENLVGADLEYCCNEFAVQYYQDNLNSNRIIRDFSKYFDKMDTNIEEIKDRYIKKGIYNSYDDELLNLKKQLEEEREIIYELKNNNESGFLRDEVEQVFKQSINKKVKNIVDKIMAKKDNKYIYKKATKD